VSWVQQLALISSFPFHISQTEPVILICGEFSPLCGKKLKKTNSVINSPFFFLKAQKKKKNKSNFWPKFATIAYNMKWWLRFFYFNILNIAKFG
jgi:hypothetical protein